MKLNYINVDNLGKIFKSYQLDKDTIIPVLINNHEDEYKYLLSMYLISTLEDYKHIIQLIQSVYYEEKFPYSHDVEILRGDIDKKFWKKVSSESPEETIKLDKYWFFNNEYRLMYINYDLLKKIQDIKKQYHHEKNAFRKFILVQNKNFIKVKHKINSFILKRSYTKHNEGLSYEEMIKKYNEIINFNIQNNTYDTDSVAAIALSSQDDLLVWGEKLKFIEKLKYDLNFNYIILTNLFNSESLTKDNLSDILYFIRKLMHDNDFSYIYETRTIIDESESDYQDIINLDESLMGVNYRQLPLLPTTQFFKNASSVDRIEEDMKQLEEELTEILKIKNDEEYVKRVYFLSQKMIQIHPYYDGNGRTTKYLLYYLLLKRNILPPTISDSNYLPDCLEKLGPTNAYIEGRVNILNNRIKKLKKQ